MNNMGILFFFSTNSADFISLSIHSSLNHQFLAQMNSPILDFPFCPSFSFHSPVHIPIQFPSNFHFIKPICPSKMTSTCISSLKSIPLILLAAILDLLVHLAFAIFVHSNTVAIEKFIFWLLVSLPSIYVIYAILKNQFGLIFLWPLAYSTFSAIAGHVLLFFVLHQLEEGKIYSSTSFLLLFQTIFYTFYAFTIAKHWKDQSDAQSQPNNLIAADGNANASAV